MHPPPCETGGSSFIIHIPARDRLTHKINQRIGSLPLPPRPARGAISDDLGQGLTDMGSVSGRGEGDSGGPALSLLLCYPE